MGETSVYKYYRPIMLLCYVLGHFPVLNVTTESAENLEFRHTSLQFIISITGTTVISGLFNFLITFQESPINNMVWGIVWKNVGYLLATWITCRAIDNVRAFNIVDKLRHTIGLLPHRLRPPTSNPTLISRAMTVSCALTIMLPIAFVLWISPPEFESHITMVSILYSITAGFTHARQCLVLSCVFYSCSKVVEDFLRAWEHYSWLNCRLFGQLHDFSQALMVQTQCLGQLDEITRHYWMAFFGVAVCDILLSMVYLVSVGEPVSAMVVNVIIWNVYLGGLVVSSQLSTIQYDNYSREVLEMAVQDMTWQDYAKVRVILNQLENSPGKFTAHGFFKVNPELMLSFLCFGIDYIIFFAQNLSELKDILEVTVPSNFTV